MCILGIHNQTLQKLFFSFILLYVCINQTIYSTISWYMLPIIKIISFLSTADAWMGSDGGASEGKRNFSCILIFLVVLSSIDHWRSGSLFCEDYERGYIKDSGCLVSYKSIFSTWFSPHTISHSCIIIFTTSTHYI